MSPKYILTSAGAEADLVFESEMRVDSSLLANGEHIQLIWVKLLDTSARRPRYAGSVQCNLQPGVLVVDEVR